MIVTPSNLLHLATHRHGAELVQRSGHLVQIKTHHSAHGHRRQRRRQVMAAPNRHANWQSSTRNVSRPLTWPMSVARRSQPSPAPTQVIGAADFEATLRSQGSSPSTARPSAGKAASNSALAWAISLPAAEAAEMGVADARDDADAGLGQFGQRGDLARPARAQFQHGVVVVRLDGRHAQGHAEVVVEISRAGRAAEPRLQHGMDHLPGGGLAGAAGHGDHRAGELAPPPPRPIVQGPCVSSTRTIQ